MTLTCYMLAYSSIMNVRSGQYLNIFIGTINVLQWLSGTLFLIIQVRILLLLQYSCIIFLIYLFYLLLFLLCRLVD